MTEPNIARHGILDCQICVPADYTDEQVLKAAEGLNPCGASGGWHIRKEGSKYLNGAPERVTCEDDPDNVHIMLDA